MNGALIWRFLIGNAEAIRQVAGSREATWTGLALVLMTSIPRNYDQTPIVENTFLWIFGGLIVSTISGAWFYVLVQSGCIRRSKNWREGEELKYWEG